MVQIRTKYIQEQKSQNINLLVPVGLQTFLLHHYKGPVMVVIQPTVCSDIPRRHTTEKDICSNIYSSCEILEQDRKWIWDIKELDWM